MCTLLLDVGPDHEPNCHIVIPCADENRSWKSTIATTIGSAGTVIDLSTMAVFETKITKRHLIEAFKQPDAVLANQQAILHYFIVHRRDMDIVNQVLLFMFNSKIELIIINNYQLFKNCIAFKFGCGQWFAY